MSGGASLYLSTSTNENALYLNGDTNSTSQNIASASSTTTYDNMVNNTWAYSTNDIDFQGVPTLDSPVLLSDIDGISTLPLFLSTTQLKSIPPSPQAPMQTA